MGQPRVSSQTSVSTCANPSCEAEFKRLGKGKLFILPDNPSANVNRLRQKAIWLCDSCAREFEVVHDPSRRAYMLARRSI
jgi:hypothetical protein